jgi:hypothetical protein
VGIGEWFSQFCTNIQVSEATTISVRYKAITRRLNTEFWNTTSETAHSLLVGSYGRRTAIRGISDVDMIMELPSSEYHKYDSYQGNGQSALLQAVKRGIEKTYSTTRIRADGQVIVVPFTDGISFEVVPAFVNQSDSYTYPCANDGGTWKTTNPRPEINAIGTRNTATNGNLISLARMLRAWKDCHAVPIGGLLIDTLAYQFIGTWEHRDKSYVYYDWMSRDFFKWASDQDASQTYWRAPGSGQSVYGKGLFQYKAKRAYNLSLEAISHESASPKREWSAKQKWREVFGSSFPS